MVPHFLSTVEVRFSSAIPFRETHFDWAYTISFAFEKYGNFHRMYYSYHACCNLHTSGKSIHILGFHLLHRQY